VADTTPKSNEQQRKGELPPEARPKAADATAPSKFGIVLSVLCFLAAAFFIGTAFLAKTNEARLRRFLAGSLVLGLSAILKFTAEAKWERKTENEIKLEFGCSPSSQPDGGTTGGSAGAAGRGAHTGGRGLGGNRERPSEAGSGGGGAGGSSGSGSGSGGSAGRGTRRE
jgi:hypothetical protein